jgi:HK97 family phage prohead protease
MIRERLVIGHVEKTYETKRLDEDGQDVPVGIVEGYLATWDVDRMNDRFRRGAFADTIADHQKRKRQLRLKRNHFGKLIGGFDPERLVEDDKGLYGVAEIVLAVDEGREAYALVKQGVLTDFSVGFSIEPEDVETVEGIRVFRRAKLFETSLVDEPANESAMITAVRAYFGDVDSRDGIIRSVAEYRKRYAEVAPDEREALETELNDRYYHMVGHASPMERGCWAWSELQALPKSLRGYIIAHERLSRDAVDAMVEAASPTERKSSTEDEANGQAQTTDGETETESEQDDVEEKAIREIADILKGAFNG